MNLRMKTWPPPGFVNEAPQNEDLVICPPPGFGNEAPQNEDLVICPPPGFVNEAPQNEDLVICPPPGFVNEAPQNEDLVICPPPRFVNEAPGLMDENAHLSGVTDLDDKNMDRTSEMVKKNVEKFDTIAPRVSIAGVKMWVEIDLCISKTMMDEIAFRKILENLKIILNKPKSNATAYGGNEIPLVGSFSTMIATKKKSCARYDYGYERGN